MGDEEQQHDLTAAMAMVLGYNELARHGASLGAKVYYRLMREGWMKEFVRLGGNEDMIGEPAKVVLALPIGEPIVRFSESDIELMREAVAAYDTAHPTKDTP